MADSIASLMVVIDAAQAALAAQKLDEVTVAGGKTEAQFKKTESASKGMLAGLQGIPASLQAIDARVDALRASVDPLAAAQRKVNAELNEAKGLYAGGALSVQEYQNAVAVLEGRLETIASAQNAYNAAQARGARQMGLTAAEGLNLSRQIADIGVSLASGQAFWMVAVQQGAQIGDVFQTAAARGVTFGTVISGMIRQVGTFVSRAGPLAAVLGAIAAGAALPWKVAAEEIEDESVRIARGLGATETQMKRLKAEGVSMGDTLGAVFEVIGQRAWKVFGDDLTALGRQAKGFYDGLVNGADKAIGWMLGAFLSFTRTVGIFFGQLPAFASEGMVSMANGVINSLEKLLNEFIGKINAIGNAVEAIAKAVGQNVTIPKVPDIDWKGWENRNAGATVEAMRKIVAAQSTAFADGQAMWGRFKADVSREAVNDALGDPGKPKKPAAGGKDKETGSWWDDVAKDAMAAMDDLIDAEYRYREAVDGAMQSTQDRIALISLERDMLGASARDREVAVAGLRAEQEAAARGFRPEDVQAYADAQRDLAGVQFDARQAQAEFNDELWRTANLWADLDAQAQDAGRGMASAFGKAGGALGDLMTLTTRYMARQTELTARRRADGVTAEEVARIDRETSRNKIALYGDMLGAAKGYFDEQSDAFKALQAVEAGYRAWQMAMSIQAMMQAVAEATTKMGADNASTTSHLANAAKTMATDAATTSTGIAAGASRIFAALGPTAFPVVAAMLGVMASLGAGGGGGGASGVSISERRQREQGTGSVLGDAAAKSESIANALEIVASNTNRDLEYSNAMLRALRSIDDQIGAVAAALARQLGASGILDTSSLNLGTVQKGGSLLSGFGFGSTTTKTLKDQGLEFTAGTLADILSKGLAGQAYQTVRTSSSSSFLGMTYSSSSSTKTKKTALDAALAEEFTRLIGSLRDGVLSAANVLGVEGADAVLAAFKVNIGKISLKDLSGEEIEKTLQAVFSKVGDDMAAAVLPGLKAVQNVGEGLFETLIRVARQYQVIDVTLSTIGKTFGVVGVTSIGARERLIDLFGSLDDFTDQVGFYAENFLTEAERLAPIQTAVTAELARLGLAGVKTRDQFKTVVQGLDVSTAAGAELFAALMSLAPAFAKVTEETQAVTDAREALSRAYERESEAILDTKDRFAQLAADLGKFRSSLYSGPAAAMSPEAAYLAAQAEFARVRGLALGGNEQALGELQSVSQAYLDASKAYFASSAGYFADLEAVRAAVTAAEGIAGAQATLAEQQLEQLKSLVSGFIEVNETLLSVDAALAALNAALGVSASPAAPAAPLAPTTQAANDNAAAQAAALDELRQELAALNGRMDALLQQNAAIYAAKRADIEAQTDELARRLRDLTA